MAHSASGRDVVSLVLAPSIAGAPSPGKNRDRPEALVRLVVFLPGVIPVQVSEIPYGRDQAAVHT